MTQLAQEEALVEMVKGSYLAGSPSPSMAKLRLNKAMDGQSFTQQQIQAAYTYLGANRC